MKELPTELKAFVERQTKCPVSELAEGASERTYPYSEHWCRFVIGALLSGRVGSRNDRYPNRTDVDRLCKEANFNQYYFQGASQLMVRAEVVEPTKSGLYRGGQWMDAFLQYDLEGLRFLTRLALIRSVAEKTGTYPWRPTLPFYFGLVEFLALFFACFEGLAVELGQAGRVFAEFSRLPEKALEEGCKVLELERLGDWEEWLDEKGQQALIDSLFEVGWAYLDSKEQWIYLNDTGRTMLGLTAPPPKPAPITEFRVLPNFCIFAGSGLPMGTLVPLFRFCKVERVDRIFEFKLEQKRLRDTPRNPEICQDLPAVLKAAEPLPDTIRRMLEVKSGLSGELRVRPCSAIVKPGSPEMLDAIRQHPKLKGYLAPGAPDGYLLIKATADLRNFVSRCQELGLDVKWE